jgi:myo-inositol-1-phosphate synthase
VLEGILGYAPEGDVRIDYFKPLADHKVAWNFIQFRGWAGHRMRLQFTWEGTDSVLAAPLVLDISRLILLAQQRGESGPVGELGLFFKTPEGSSEMNLYKQYAALLRWSGARVADA